jgi:hypothetical protein
MVLQEWLREVILRGGWNSAVREMQRFILMAHLVSCRNPGYGKAPEDRRSL